MTILLDSCEDSVILLGSVLGYSSGPFFPFPTDAEQPSSTTITTPRPFREPL
jgi:hypothetical protein